MKMTKATEILVCCNLGIVQDGEDVTVQSLDTFTSKFKSQLLAVVLTAMRALFKVDDDQVTTVEDALIAHGGADTLDCEAVSGESIVSQSGAIWSALGPVASGIYHATDV